MPRKWRVRFTSGRLDGLADAPLAGALKIRRPTDFSRLAKGYAGCAVAPVA
jgi:hypothetical protein